MSLLTPFSCERNQMMLLSVPESVPPSITYINRSFDVFVEAVFIFDVILNFRTTFVSKSGNVVFTPHLIRVRNTTNNKIYILFLF